MPVDVRWSDGVFTSNRTKTTGTVLASLPTMPTTQQPTPLINLCSQAPASCQPLTTRLHHWHIVSPQPTWLIFICCRLPSTTHSRRNWTFANLTSPTIALLVWLSYHRITSWSLPSWLHPHWEPASHIGVPGSVVLGFFWSTALLFTPWRRFIRCFTTSPSVNKHHASCSLLTPKSQTDYPTKVSPCFVVTKYHNWALTNWAIIGRWHSTLLPISQRLQVGIS